MDEGLEVSSAARLGNNSRGKLLDLLLSGAASVTAGGDIGCQSTEETVVNVGGADGLDGQALGLLLLLLREGESRSHCDELGVCWKCVGCCCWFLRRSGEFDEDGFVFQVGESCNFYRLC